LPVDPEMRILAIDVGTTAMKMGVYRVPEGDEGSGSEPTLVREFFQGYSINIYNSGLFGDIEQEKWIRAVFAGCDFLSDQVPQIDVISISGTTPGLTAMDGEGDALYPAILMLDQRSRKQAREIIETIGLERLLSETGNMPVAGGCSLASMLWLRENEPSVWNKTACFGHSNTYLGYWLTGRFAMDPSSASLTAVYNTAANDLTWNRQILSAFGLSPDRLPELMWSFDSPGRVLPERAKQLGFKNEPPVVIGGNDAVLAAYSAGVRQPGELINVNGTCEITLVCLPHCHSSKDYNIRAHVIPGLWLTLYVMNAGGKAYEWFQKVFCSEMSLDQFYLEFVPRSIEKWLECASTVEYVPYLMGSRYSLTPLRAEFKGLTQESGREELLAAMVRGLCGYQRAHIEDIAAKVPLHDTIYVTGGANTPAVVRAKEIWMRSCNYLYRDQSSVKGAALLGHEYLKRGVQA
jgi:sugar (pentulose or hexulose) kinase